MTTPPPDNQPEVTLRDILTHIQGLRAEFTERMDRLEARMDRMEGRIDRMEGRMERMEIRLGSMEQHVKDLHLRIDVLEEDLKITIKETFIIRRHVGLSVGENDGFPLSSPRS